MSENGIAYERVDSIGWLTFNRPEKMNALTYAMLDRIEAAVREARDDDAVRALVVTGAGRAFCAGTDLAELSERLPAEARPRAAEAPDPDRPAPWTLLSLPKPVIAAVNGAAVGLGAEFSLQADLRLAGESARFSWIFPQRGLVPDTGAGTWLLPRVIGLARAAKLLYTGAMIDAAEALRIGLVDEVVPDGALHGRADELAQQMARGAPLAVEQIKRLLYQGLARDARAHVDDNAQTLTRMFATEDHREGVRSFLERREPHFVRR
ncbi:MAG TPA: enoyl-CoA hydratase-related protein [Dehalococcoidia bacterium]|nr:enoyl-CoA hydratase-related protein [Dehalococcoidia bacterium]